MVAALRFFSLLDIIWIPTPIIAKIGENDVGFNNSKIKPAPLISAKLKIHAVIVVPTLAPRITPTALDKLIIPELTKPTTITVVAEDDWIIAVTPAPSNTAINLLEVSFSRIISSLPPDAFLRPSPNTSIPYKNRASPPINVKKPKISMSFSYFTDVFFIKSPTFDKYILHYLSLFGYTYFIDWPLNLSVKRRYIHGYYILTMGAYIFLCIHCIVH